MTLSLHNMGKKKKASKRLGRGNASGHGTYSGKGQKGQRARSGGKPGLKLFGFRRTLLNTPKMKGMKPKAKAEVVLISSLEKCFSDNDKVNVAALFAARLVNVEGARRVKILSNDAADKLSKKLVIEGCTVSASARAIIEKAGGEIIAPAEKALPKKNK
jgi:large subunit ribosomal protein L15